MNGSLTIRTHEFFVESRDTDRSHVIMAITEPKDAAEAGLKGTLFIVFEIEQGNARITEYVHDIVRFIERTYYDEYAGERNHFEDTVVKTNQLLRGFQLPTTTGIHTMVGVVKKSALTFVTHGEPHAWLFAKGTREPHALIVAPGKEARESGSFFSELVEGNLSIQDVVLFASTHVGDYFTPDRLSKIVRGHSSEEIARHLLKILKDLGSGLAFAGIVAEAVPAPGGKPISNFTVGSHASIEALLAGRDRTAEFLMPTVFRNTGHWLREQWEARPRTGKLGQRANAAHPTRASADHLLLGHLIWFLVKNFIILVIRLLRGILFAFWHAGLWFIALVRSTPHDRRTLRSTVAGQTKNQFSLWFRRFRTLPASKQLVVLGIAALIVFIVGGSGTLIYQRFETKRLALSADLVQRITRNHEEAQAKVIYGADADARALLKDAEQLIAQLPVRGRREKQERDDLRGLIAATLSELRKELFVMPRLLAPIAEATLAPPRHVGLLPGTLVATSLHTAHGIMIDTVTGATREISTPAPLTNAAYENGALVWQQGNQLLAMDKDGATKPIFEQLGAGRDYTIFNKRLYILVPDKEQIIAHAPRADGFAAAGASWITENTVLPFDAQLVTSDGDLYVFSSGGSVIRFRRGKSIDFNFIPIDPSLTSIKQVWTSETTKFLYVLDVTQARLIVFDKEGRLKAQYRADAFPTASDFVVDEATKRAYVVANEGVWEFELAHLEQ